MGVRDILLPGLKPHPFDPAKGLDMTDVAILAVVNNPALRTARAQAHAGEAQAFVAGLLPGPQINYSLDHPTHQGPQYVNAYSAGLAYELTALLAHGAARAASRATAKQVDLDLLWQEWQVAQQARLLYVDCLNNERKLSVLKRLQDGMQQGYRAEQRAYKAGNLSLADLGLDLAVLQNLQTLASTTATSRNAGCRALNEILGLKPEVELKLVPDEALAPDISAHMIDEALVKLPQPGRGSPARSADAVSRYQFRYQPRPGHQRCAYHRFQREHQFSVYQRRCSGGTRSGSRPRRPVGTISATPG